MALQASASPVRSSAASERLVEAIRDLILGERLRPGTHLGSERALIDSSGLSRPTVREAIRILEREGMVRVKPGPGGGLIVRGMDHTLTTRALGDLLEYEATPPQDFLEARAEIEATCARLAALRATERDLKSITDALVELESTARVDSAFIAESNLRFHLAIAEASHNHVLLRMAQSLLHLVLRSSIRVDYTAPLKAEMIRAHRRVLDAIQGRDPGAADRRMRRHTAAFVEYVERTGQAERLRERSDPGTSLVERLRALVEARVRSSP